jgi:hypothetical protein
MVIIVWNSTGLSRIATLQKGGKFNADYYISEICAPFVEWHAGQMGVTDQKLIVYSDNARLHTTKSVNKFLGNNGMTRVLHPSYSPDLAQCDFFLFSSIKNQLMRRSFDDADQSLMAINEVCECIEKSVLEKVFHEWRERLAKYLVSDSGLVENI